MTDALGRILKALSLLGKTTTGNFVVFAANETMELIGGNAYSDSKKRSIDNLQRSSRELLEVFDRTLTLCLL